MIDNRGSAVALVLLILAVVSLAGVALMTQSRLDIRLTSSIKNYDKMFSLADGGSTISFQDLLSHNRELQYPNNNTLALYTSQPVTGVPEAGKYSSKLILNGYSTSPQDSAGWDVSQYYPEFWIGRGKGKRNIFGGAESTVDSSVKKMNKRE
ncbi:MAG: pilus assembly PilX N-terminal domain-containing protein [Deltaproteobacteria bacterium]